MPPPDTLRGLQRGFLDNWSLGGNPGFEARLDPRLSEPAPEPAGEIARGLSRGYLGLKADLQGLAGGMGAALGAEQFAAGRYAAAGQALAQAQAPERAARVGTWDAVHGAGDAFDYAAGKAAESAPALAATLAAMALTRGRIHPLAAGTAVQAPLNTGDVLLRQQQDPQARQRAPGENLLHAATAGTASAALQNIVPAALGGRLFGPLAGHAAAQETGQQLAHTGLRQAFAIAAPYLGAMGRDAALNAAAGAAGEIVQQQGVTPGGPVDWQPVQEAAIGGGVIGAPLGLAGHAAQRLRQAGHQAAGETGPVKDSPPEAAQEAPQDATLAELNAALHPDDTAQRLAQGAPLGDLDAVAGAQGDGLLDTLDKAWALGKQKAGAFRDALFGRADLTPEQRQQVEAAGDKLDDPQQQARVAALKLAKDGKDRFMAAAHKISALLGGLGKPDAPDSATRPSLDPSGIRQAIVRRLLPHVPEEVINDPQALDAMGEAVRQYVQAAGNNDYSRMQSAGRILQDTLGAQTGDILSDIHKLAGDGQTSERFYGHLNALREDARRDGGLASLIAGNLPEGSEADPRALSDVLLSWARGERGADLKGEESRFFHARVRDTIAEAFGPNTDKVMDALERYTSGERPPDVLGREDLPQGSGNGDDGGAPLHEQEAGRLYFGGGRSAARADELLADPRLFEAQYGKTNSRTHELIGKLQAQYPDAQVRFVSQAERHRIEGSSAPGDPARGYVMVEKLPGDRAALTPQELDAARLDTHRWARSDSRLDVDGTAYDAVKLAQAAGKKLPPDDAYGSGAARTARRFMHGAAQLMAQGGAFDIPDGLRIGKNLTWGQAKEALAQAHAAQGSHENQGFDGQEPADTRTRYLDTQRKLQRTEWAMLNALGDREQVADLRQRWVKLSAKLEALDARDNLEQHLQETGRQDAGKDGNIHEAGTLLEPDALIHRANLDGTPHWVSGQPLDEGQTRAIKSAQLAAAKLIDSGNAIARNTGQKLDALLARGGYPLSAADIARLDDAVRPAGGQRSVSTLAPVVNALYAKYKEILKQPAPNLAGPGTGANEATRTLAIPVLLHTLGVDPSKASPAAREIAGRVYDDVDTLRLLGERPHTTELALRAYGERIESAYQTLAEEHPQEREAVYKGRDFVLSRLVNATALRDDASNAGVRERLKQPTTLSAVAGHIADTSGNAFAVTLAKALRKVAGDTPVSPGGLLDLLGDGGPNGMYGPSDKAPLGAINTASRLSVAPTAIVLHEGVHAATLRALADDPNLYHTGVALFRHALKHDPWLEQQYAGTNSLEFIAEGLSNPAIQEHLRRIPASEQVRGMLGKVKTMWDAFVALARKALEMGEEHQSAMSQLLELGGAAMHRTGGENAAQPGFVAAMSELLSAQQSMYGEPIRAVHAQLSDVPMDAGIRDVLDELKDRPTKPALMVLQELRDKVRSGALSRITEDDVIQAGTTAALHAPNPIAGPSLEATPDPKAVAAKKAALVQKARSGDATLSRQLAASTDAPGLQRAAIHLNEHAPDTRALEVINDRLDRLVHDPDVAYSLQTPGKGRVTADEKADVLDYVHKVLGDKVAVAWANLTHAGEFSRDALGETIRLSVHALNPRSVAYHEALHAWFARLRDAGAHDVTGVLEQAASEPAVRRQMEAFFKDEPDVLGQIRGSAEERAAYMYQLWAQGQLKVGATRSLLTRIGGFIRSALGIWSNDQRALHILDYFNSGQYGKGQGDMNAVHRALMEPGRNQAIETLQSWTEPFREMGAAVLTAGARRVRETGHPSLNTIADLIKPALTQAHQDAGYLAASRNERAVRMNRLAEALKAVSGPELGEALEALQRGTQAVSANARQAQVTVRKVLRDTRAYMTRAGLDVGDLGPDYFPRIWDTGYLSAHQGEFRAMLDKYTQAGQFHGDADKVLRRLISNEGNDFDTDTRAPGMQFLKERSLAFISGEDAAPFLNKNLYQSVNSYITQAARRAEWARRFGANGEKLDALLQRARAEGATDKQIELTEKYLSGVKGTLGEGISPGARRLMGNLMVYQNLRLLPLAIFSSVVDPLGIWVRGGSAGDAWRAFTRGVAEILKNFTRYDPNAASDYATHLAETLGVIDHAALTHSLGALYSQGMTGEAGRRINDTFFRFNLMEQFNTSMRVAATEAAVKFLARHAQRPSPHSARWLAELGLAPEDIRMNNGRVALTEADGLNANHALKMRNAVNRWVDGAVLRPDAADKPVWMNDPHYALVAHLKQFTYSFQHTILDRVKHEAREGNYTPAMALAGYVPIMIAADYAKGMIQGGGSQPDWKKDWDLGDYLANGIQRAGLYGTGQFGADFIDDIRHGGSGFGALEGPTLEQLTDAIKVAGGRERFGNLALQSMPAHALYGWAFEGGGGRADPKFAE